MSASKLTTTRVSLFCVLLLTVFCCGVSKGSEDSELDLSDVTRLYESLISTVRAEVSKPRALLKFLHGWRSRLRTLEKIIVFYSSNETKSKVTETLHRFRWSSCSRAIIRISKFFRKAIKISNACNFQQFHNGTIFWDCTPSRNIRKLKNLFWVFLLLDSWGRPSPGLTSQGQFLWYGDFRQCLDTEVPIGLSPVHYCMVKTGTLEQMQMKKDSGFSYLEGDAITLPVFVMKLGLCLPQACNSSTMEDTFNFLAEIFLRKNLSSTSMGKKLVSVHCSSDAKYDTSIGKILTVSGISTLAALIVLGTAVDYLRDKRNWFRSGKKLKESKHFQVAKSLSILTRTTNETKLIRQFELEAPLSYKSLRSLRRTVKKPRWWLKFLIAFSLRLNLAWIFYGKIVGANGNGGLHFHRSTDPGGDQITCIFGIKFWSMVWIIAGHTYLFAVPYMGNIASFAGKLRRELFAQLILNASLSVDTFFLISGLLLSYIWYRRTERNGGKQVGSVRRWLLFWGHRWLRLSPACILVLAFAFYIFPTAGSGPNWNPSQLFGVQCSGSDWWKHLLFLTNIFPTQCLPWMWFLSVDMQFYLISPIFLIFCWKSRSSGWTVAGFVALILISALSRGIVVSQKNYPPNLLLLLPNEQFDNDLRSFFYTVYTMPYMRIGPFLVGFIFGWRLATNGHRMGKLRLQSRWQLLLKWIVGCCLAVWCLFGAYPLFTGFHSSLYNFLLSSFARTVWALTVGIFVELCHTTPQNPLNVFLSWPGWRPFSRLTYCAYLSHELIIVGYFQSKRYPESFEGHIQMIVYSMGFVFLSYFVSIPINLLVESPPLALERLLFKRRSRSLRTRSKRERVEGKFPSINKLKRVVGWVEDPNLKISTLPEESGSYDNMAKDVEEYSEFTDQTQLSLSTCRISFDDSPTVYFDEEDVPPDPPEYGTCDMKPPLTPILRLPPPKPTGYAEQRNHLELLELALQKNTRWLDETTAITRL